MTSQSDIGLILLLFLLGILVGALLTFEMTERAHDREMSALDCVYKEALLTPSVVCESGICTITEEAVDSTHTIHIQAVPIPAGEGE